MLDFFSDFLKLERLKVIPCFTPEMFQESMREHGKTTQTDENTLTVEKAILCFLSGNSSKRYKGVEVKHGINFKWP